MFFLYRCFVNFFYKVSREIFLSILVYASGSNFVLQPNPLSHSMHLIQTLWNSQCHSFWHLLHQTAILCKSKSLSVLNFVSQSSHLTQFWRSPLKMKYARNFAQRFSLWYLKILPFSKSCSQLSHLTIKDLKNNSIILQVSGSNTLVLLPCNLAAYWFKVDCYSRLIFSVVKFGAGTSICSSR